MVHILKIYVASKSEIPDIRRVAVNSDVLNSYQILVNKIISVIPKLIGKHFELCWKDDDGDDIVITSDDELAQAIANSEDSVIKIYVRFTGTDAEQKNNTTGDAHRGIICDGCHREVIGYRYKCLQCEDFDLCHDCNASGKHPFHDMLKLASPAHYFRKWLFVGWKQLFRSAFGLEPIVKMIDRGENPPKCPYLASQNRPLPKMDADKSPKCPYLASQNRPLPKMDADKSPKCPYLASQNRPLPKMDADKSPKCPYLAGQNRSLPKMDASLKELLEDKTNSLENTGQFFCKSLSSSGVNVEVEVDHLTKESSPSESVEAEEVQKDLESPENSIAKSVESEEQKRKVVITESEHNDEAISTTAESKHVTEGTNSSVETGNFKWDGGAKPKSRLNHFELLNALVANYGIDGSKSPPKCPHLAGQKRFLREMISSLKEQLKDTINLLENTSHVCKSQSSSVGVNVKVDVDSSTKESSTSEFKEAKEEVQKYPESPENSVVKSVEGEELKKKVVISQSKLTDEVISTTAESKHVTEDTNPSADAGSLKRDEETKRKSPSAFEILNESLVSDGTADGFTVITTSSWNQADEKNETIVQPTAPEADENIQYHKLMKTRSDGKRTPLFYKCADADPQVVNALNKMCSMGFKNEGGWLFRLLQAKKGNINEALDALYPNRKRR